MKLRVYQDSIRLRVQMPEIEALKSDRQILASVNLGLKAEESIHYRVVLSDVPAPRIDVENNIISLLLPEEIGLHWANSNEVGIYASQEVADGKSLKIILEKDFKCLDDTFEDQSIMFPNPKETC